MNATETFLGEVEIGRKIENIDFNASEIHLEKWRKKIIF